MSGLGELNEGRSEASFADLYQRAPCGYLSTTPDGVVVQVNDTLLRWTGHRRDDLVGTPFVDLLDAGSRLFYETRQLPVLRLNGEVREVALTMNLADGGSLPILINSVIIIDETAQPRVIRFAVFDATARQDYERQLLAARRDAEQSEQRVRVLQDAAAAFSGLDSESDVDDAIADSFRTAFDASVVVLLDVDEHGVPRPKSGSTPLDPYLGDEPERPIAVAALSGEIVTVSSPSDADERFPGSASAMRAARYDALTATPLIHDGTVLGVVACLFRREREFDARAIDLHSALARQAAQVLARLQLQRQLEALALHDQLTGLGNRVLLEAAIEQALQPSAHARRPVALIFVDLDGFKIINDDLGHMMGDGVLQEVTWRLKESVRHDDTVGRLGGDEFLIVCDDADAVAAQAIAERICAAIRQPLNGIASRYRVTASIGVAVKPAESDGVVSATVLIGLADAAMYESKQAGKDRITLVTA
jgi:diguanylate cyclase (GGDEF)-like protein/PAS domain S-box-containing protein